jgi:hypothetical protein
MIPPEVLELRSKGQLHKLAEQRTGIADFGLDTAVGHLAKKAYYTRQINKAIAASINSVDYISK